MTTQFAILQLPLPELKELHRALLARFVMDEAIRHEQGLEEPEYPQLLKRMEQLLGMNEDAAHALYHQVEDELWEYAWFTYTDEWALYRARRDVEKDLGRQKSSLSTEELDAMVDRRYQERFDRYAKEIDMREEEKKSQETRRRTQEQKK